MIDEEKRKRRRERDWKFGGGIFYRGRRWEILYGGERGILRGMVLGAESGVE